MRNPNGEGRSVLRHNIVFQKDLSCDGIKKNGTLNNIKV